MKLKVLLLGMLALFVLGFCGCGSKADGLNGALTVTAAATGSVITGTVTYTNPTETNLIGVPIDLSVQVGSTVFNLGRHYTNNSGSINFSFSPPAFDGSQTIVVLAKADKLTGFAPVTMTGRALTVNSPPAITVPSTGRTIGEVVPFLIPATSSFVTVSDPFGGGVVNHPIEIRASYVSTTPGTDVLNLVGAGSTQTVTVFSNSAGVAPFPGATGTLTVPAAGASDTMVITWFVTDLVTGLTGTGQTTVTLTNTNTTTTP